MVEAAETGVARTTRFSYDPNGNRTLIRAPGAEDKQSGYHDRTTCTAYDGSDRPWKTTVGFDTAGSGDGATRTQITEYDAQGNLRRVVNPRGVDGHCFAAQPQVADGDPQGRFTGLPGVPGIAWARDATVADYDPDGLLRHRYLPYGDNAPGTDEGAIDANGADQLRDLGLHQRAGHPGERLAHEIGALSLLQVADDLLCRHSLLLGHRGAPLVEVGGSTPTIMGPAVAGTTLAAKFRPTRSYTTSWDLTRGGDPGCRTCCDLAARCARTLSPVHGPFATPDGAAWLLADKPALWRAWERSGGPVSSLAILSVIALGVIRLASPDTIQADGVLGVIQYLLVCAILVSIALLLTTSFWAWPRALLPKHLRDSPSLIEEYRLHGAEVFHKPRTKGEEGTKNG